MDQAFEVLMDKIKKSILPTSISVRLLMLFLYEKFVCYIKKTYLCS